MNLQLLGLAVVVLTLAVAAGCYALWRRGGKDGVRQVLAVAILIAYLGALSIISMYVQTLPAPCAARGDCADVQARGGYTGD